MEKISYQVNSELEGYSEGIVAEGTILSANPDEQWKTLKAKLIFSKTEYTRKREELYRKIQTTVTTYKDIALAEIVSKEAKSVLILDNPFGKITSAHLLKPMVISYTRIKPCTYSAYMQRKQYEKSRKEKQ